MKYTSEERFHERRIEALGKRYRIAMGADKKRAANKAWAAMVAAIKQRSPAVVENICLEKQRDPKRCRGFRA